MLKVFGVGEGRLPGENSTGWIDCLLKFAACVLIANIATLLFGADQYTLGCNLVNSSSAGLCIQCQ